MNFRLPSQNSCRWPLPVLALLLCAAAAAAEAAERPPVVVDAGIIESRVANVTRLIDVSSGAVRVQASDNEAAKTSRREALALLEKAKAAAKVGQLEAASELLDEATSRMFAAVRALGEVREISDKKQRDFDDRARSVEALSEALARISSEKGDARAARKTLAGIEAEVARAQALVTEGKLDEGRALLDAAYETTKLAVEDLREGETVVRSLHFETREEEYRYELDRNETHRMLIKMLAGEKREVEAVDQMVRKFIAKSNDLRREAEMQAEAGDYDAAIEYLEQSTKELVRAIRSAGIYIPS